MSEKKAEVPESSKNARTDTDQSGQEINEKLKPQPKHILFGAVWLLIGIVSVLQLMDGKAKFFKPIRVRLD